MTAEASRSAPAARSRWRRVGIALGAGLVALGTALAPAASALGVDAEASSSQATGTERAVDRPAEPGAPADEAAAERGDEDAKGVDIAVRSIDDGVFAETETVTLEVAVHNGTDADLRDRALELYTSYGPITTPSDYASIFDRDLEHSQLGLYLSEQRVSVPRGETKRVSFEIKPAEVPNPRSFGARSVHAKLVDGVRQTALGAGVFVWNARSGGSVQPVMASIVAPVSRALTMTDGFDAAALDDATGPDSDLAKRVSTLASAGVSLAIDPALMLQLRTLGGEAPASATALAASLENPALDTLGVPFGDPDLSALAGARASGAFGPQGLDEYLAALAAGKPTSLSLGGSALKSGLAPGATAEALAALPASMSGIAWPIAGTVTGDTLRLARTTGADRVLLSSSDLAVSSRVRTPDVIAELDGASDDESVTRALVAQSDVTSALNRAAFASSDADWSSAMNELAGRLAMIGSGRASGDAARVLLTLDRGTAVPARLEQTLAALRGSGLVSTESLGALVSQAEAARQASGRAGSGSSAVALARASSADAGADAADDDATKRVRAARAALSAVQRIDGFLTSFGDAAWLSLPAHLQAIDLTSAAPLLDSGARDALAKRADEDARALTNRVRIQTQADFILVANDSRLPIPVTNELPVPVRVTVSLRALQGRLVVRDVDTVTIDPGASVRAFIPVEAVSNGDVTVEVHLTDMAGREIGEPLRTRVNVQAQWEGIGIGIVAAALVLVFGGGIVRAVLRRRRGGGADRERADDELERPRDTIEAS